MSERQAGLSIDFKEHPDGSVGQLFAGPSGLIERVVATARAGSAWKPKNDLAFSIVEQDDGRLAVHLNPRAIGELTGKARNSAIEGVNRVVGPLVGEAAV